MSDKYPKGCPGCGQKNTHMSECPVPLRERITELEQQLAIEQEMVVLAATKLTTLEAENERLEKRIEGKDLFIGSLEDTNTKLQEQVKVYRGALEKIVIDGDYTAPELMKAIARQALNQDTEKHKDWCIGGDKGPCNCQDTEGKE